MECAFCRIQPDKYLVENEYFFAIRDIHPVSKGHCLIVAKRCIQDFFELAPEEMAALHSISVELRGILDKEFQPDGYNLGMNCGLAAGQSVFHFHMHFIPRYRKDRNTIRSIREYIREIM